MYLNKTQKILAGSFAAVAALGTGIGIGAGIWAGGSNGNEVMLVTDGGSITDKSFNEQSYDALNQYGSLTGKSFGYAQPDRKDTTKEGLMRYYNTYLSQDTNTLVLPGYIHEQALWAIQNKYEDKHFIFIDDGGLLYQNQVDPDGLKNADWGDVITTGSLTQQDLIDNINSGHKTLALTLDKENNRDTSNDPGSLYTSNSSFEVRVYQYIDNEDNLVEWNYDNGNQGWGTDELDKGSVPTAWSSVDNVSSIKYNSEETGFAVGIIGSYYVTSKFDNPAEWNLGGWVGLAIPTTIDFMSGYVQGVNFFNEYIFGETGGNPFYYADSSTTNIVKVLSPKGTDKTNSNGSYSVGNVMTDSNSDSWATGGFESDKGESYPKLLMDKNVNAIFPVAGPQTSWALQKAKDDVKVIGVDTNAKDVYNYDSKVLTSALKVINSPIDSDAKTDQDKANSGGPVVKAMYDYGKHGVTLDYVGSFANNGVSFVDDETTKSVYSDWFDKHNYNNINTDLKTYLPTDLENSSFTELIPLFINYINSEGIALTGDKNLVGLQQIDNTYFNNFNQ